MKQGYNNTWGDTYGFGSGGNTVFDQQDDWDLGETRQFDKAIKSLESQSKSYEKQAVEIKRMGEESCYRRMALQTVMRELFHNNKIDMTIDEFVEQKAKDFQLLEQGAKVDELVPAIKK